MIEIFKAKCCPESNELIGEILICDVLSSLGYEEGIKIFKEETGLE